MFWCWAFFLPCFLSLPFLYSIFSENLKMECERSALALGMFECLDPTCVPLLVLKADMSSCPGASVCSSACEHWCRCPKLYQSIIGGVYTFLIEVWTIWTISWLVNQFFDWGLNYLNNQLTGKSRLQDASGFHVLEVEAALKQPHAASSTAAHRGLHDRRAPKKCAPLTKQLYKVHNTL